MGVNASIGEVAITSWGAGCRREGR